MSDVIRRLPVLVLALAILASVASCSNNTPHDGATWLLQALADGDFYVRVPSSPQDAITASYEALMSAHHQSIGTVAELWFDNRGTSTVSLQTEFSVRATSQTSQGDQAEWLFEGVEGSVAMLLDGGTLSAAEHRRVTALHRRIVASLFVAPGECGHTLLMSTNVISHVTEVFPGDVVRFPVHAGRLTALPPECS